MVIIYQHLLEYLRNAKATLHESIKVTKLYSDSTMSHFQGLDIYKDSGIVPFNALFYLDFSFFKYSQWNAHNSNRMF